MRGLVDTHNHLSCWSPDATQTYEELMEEAKRLGLHGVAITDHYDPGFVLEDGKEWIFDPGAYMEAFFDRRQLPSKESQGDRPGFLVGIELGWTPEASQALHKIVGEHPFDIVIVSIHLLRQFDPFTNGRRIFVRSLEKVYDDVIRTIADSVMDMTEAHIVGHFDFFSRYAPDRESKMLYRHAPAAFNRLFDAMARNGQVMEINTKTIQSLIVNKSYTFKEALPDHEILYRYRERCGPYLTIGSDAHHADQRRLIFQETVDYIAGLDWFELVWFEQGVRVGNGESIARFSS